MTGVEEVFVDYRSTEGERITHIRSTLVGASIQTLKSLGLIERYLAVLPRVHHDAMLAPRAPGWVDVEEAALHYNACQNMDLSPEELEALSATVVDSVVNTLLGTFTRSARPVGMTPWISLAQTARIFARLNRGGSLRMIRRGENEALAEVRGGSLYTIPYYSAGHCGMLRGATLIFAKTARVRIIAVDRTVHRAMVQWT